MPSKPRRPASAAMRKKYTNSKYEGKRLAGNCPACGNDNTYAIPTGGKICLDCGETNFNYIGKYNPNL